MTDEFPWRVLPSVDLEARTRSYEKHRLQTFMPMLPIIARLDGRKFSTFTRDVERPFSAPFRAAMMKLTRYLAQEWGTTLAHSASDEISLLWKNEFGTEVPFGSSVQKFVSSLAADATAYFNIECKSLGAGMNWNLRPTFDARVFQVPNAFEATSYFVHRQNNAAGNSVQMAARAKFSHGSLHKKSFSAMQEMLHAEGINWNDYPFDMKRGTFVQRQVSAGRILPEEFDALPPKHNARTDPNFVIERSSWIDADYHLTRIANRVNVVMHGELPVSYFKESCDE